MITGNDWYVLKTTLFSSLFRKEKTSFGFVDTNPPTSYVCETRESASSELMSFSEHTEI